MARVQTGQIRISVDAGTAPRRLAGELRREASALRRVVMNELALREDDLLTVFDRFAPEDTGRLKEELVARLSFQLGRISVTVHSPVRDPDSGYPYTDVTRKGHRGEIHPVTAQRLVFFRYGALWVLPMTRGYHPETDWVEDAMPEADRISGEIADRVGRVVYTRLLS